MNKHAYETMIEEILLAYPYGSKAHDQLEPEFLDYCQKQAQEYDLPEEVQELLLACGYVTQQVVKRAWEDHPSGLPKDLLPSGIVIGLGLWERGVLTNLTENFLKEAYHALLRWWSRLCHALRSNLRMSLEDECARAIALATDLTLSKYAPAM